MPKCASPFSHDDPVDFARLRLGFDPDPKQAEVLRSTAKRGILNCTRQWGKTTVSAAKLIHRAYTHPETTSIVASPGARQSGEWMTRAARMLRQLDIKPRGDGRNEISLLLPNGSRIIGLPGQGANVRSFSAISMLVIDEAAWVPDEVYIALRPMLATSKGDIWMMSTPNGKAGFFYETWQHGGPGWHRIQVKATDCPRISPEFLEEQRLVTGIDMFAREHMCEFLGSGFYAFDRDLIEAALEKSLDPLSLDGIPKMLLPRPAWLSTQPEYFFLGLDLGKKRDYAALSVVLPYRDEFRVLCAERFPLGTTFTRIVEVVRDLVHTPYLKGRCALAFDATGLGDPVKEMIQQAELDCPWSGVVISCGSGSGRSSRIGGLNHVPKQTLMLRLQLALEKGELKIAQRMKESGALVQELLNIRIGENGGMAAEGAHHDDLVLAVALACWRANRGFNDRGSGGFL